MRMNFMQRKRLRNLCYAQESKCKAKKTGRKVVRLDR
jgi:hypothetical protein